MFNVSNFPRFILRETNGACAKEGPASTTKCGGLVRGQSLYSASTTTGEGGGQPIIIPRTALDTGKSLTPPQTQVMTLFPPPLSESQFVVQSEWVESRRNQSNLWRLVTSYHEHGHKIAATNPLGIKEK